MCENRGVLIVSVLGRFVYNEANYSVQGVDVGSYNHSSIALKHYFEDRGYSWVSLLYVVPESLVTFLCNNIADAEEILVDESKLVFKSCEKIKNQLGIKDFEAFITDSFGKYSGNGYTVVFDTPYDNVVVSLLAELAKRVFAEEGENRTPKLLVVDASTGHNIYALALVDAVRSITVCSKLKSMLAGEKTPIKTWIATCSPITTGVKESRIELSELDVKAFFSFPAKSLEGIKSPTYLLEDKRVGVKLAEENNVSGIMRKIAAGVCWAKLAFNAIKYNAPLTLYGEDNGILNFEEEAINACRGAVELLSKIKHILRSKIYTKIKAIEEPGKNKRTTIVVKRPRVIRDKAVEILLSACLATGIAEFWIREVKGKTPCTREILGTFKKLYERIGQGLAKRFLERDVEEIEWVVEKACEKGWSGDEKTLQQLSELIEQEESSGKVGKSVERIRGEKKAGDKKRNFFAHSGFLKNITVVKRSGDKIILSYTKEKSVRREVLEWLRNPEDN